MTSVAFIIISPEIIPNTILFVYNKNKQKNTYQGFGLIKVYKV